MPRPLGGVVYFHVDSHSAGAAPGGAEDYSPQPYSVPSFAKEEGGRYVRACDYEELEARVRRALQVLRGAERNPNELLEEVKAILAGDDGRSLPHG